MSNLDDKILSLRPGARIDLFDIDLRKKGGGILRLTPNRHPVLPPTVLRVSDVRTNATPRFMYAHTMSAPEGSRIFVEGIVRRVSGTSYPVIGIQGAGGQASRYWRIRVNTNTGASSIHAAGDLVTNGGVTSAVCGEYIYFCGRFTVAAYGDFDLAIFPAYGEVSSYPGGTQQAATGTVDAAMIKISRRSGGTMIPFPVSMDADLWARANAADPFPENIASEAQFLKVPVWNGNAYTPIPIEATGFERSGTGAFPRPRLRMSNLFSEGSALAQEFGDMRGATVIRRRIYADNLDNARDPDPLATFTPEIYQVDRKAMQNSILTEWELASVLDQQGVKLPGRQVLRDVCPWVYRVWNGSEWEYAGDEGCPYTGAAMYDVNGEPVTNPEEDRCSHSLTTGCRARYGTRQTLPFGGFPMAGRL